MMAPGAELSRGDPHSPLSTPNLPFVSAKGAQMDMEQVRALGRFPDWSDGRERGLNASPSRSAL
jgi:hypothetical protein